MPARTRLILSLCTVIFVTSAQGVAAQASNNANAAPAMAALPLASASTATTAPASQTGPTMEAVTVGLQRQSTVLTEAQVTNALAAQRRNAGLGQAQAMMIVGGAAILVGAIVGDSPGQIIMIGGAVVGLVGLYKYLQ